MFALKVVSIIYMAALLFMFISSDCKATNTEESAGYKFLSLLQGGALAYIIMN